MDSLKGSRVLVVGGSSGIGLATAAECIELGAEVTIASRPSEKLEQVCREFDVPVDTLAIDVGSDESVRNAFDGKENWHHIVVSAGGVRAGQIRERPLEEAFASINVKFWGAYSVVALAPVH